MSDDRNQGEQPPEFAEQPRQQHPSRIPGELGWRPGCFFFALCSVIALFIAVVGLCGGGGAPGDGAVAVFFVFLVLAAILFVAAIVIGVYKLFTGH